MKDKIIERLSSLGYDYSQNLDSFLIDFTSEKVLNFIKSECNVESIPKGLENIFIDRVCGEFLMFKKQTNQLENIDFSPVAKQISEGDTSVSFFDGTTTPEQRFDSLINFLLNSGNGSFSSYRRVRW